jgi:hypothetical protein
MFVLTTLAYPAVLLLLCAGAGLLLDSTSGRWLPACSLPVVGASALTAVSQRGPDLPHARRAPAARAARNGARELALPVRWLLLVARASQRSVSSWALEGATASVIVSPRLGTEGSPEGSDHDPSRATLRPPSWTPDTADGEGAVSVSTRASA